MTNPLLSLLRREDNNSADYICKVCLLFLTPIPWAVLAYSQRERGMYSEDTATDDANRLFFFLMFGGLATALTMLWTYPIWSVANHQIQQQRIEQIRYR